MFVEAPPRERSTQRLIRYIMSTILAIWWMLTPMATKGYKRGDFSGDPAYPRLINLWDMLQFKASLFIAITEALTFMEESAKRKDGLISDQNQEALLGHLKL